MARILIGKQISPANKIIMVKLYNIETQKAEFLVKADLNDAVIYNGEKIAPFKVMTTKQRDGSPCKCLWIDRKLINKDKIAIISEHDEVLEYPDTQNLINITDTHYVFCTAKCEITMVSKEEIKKYVNTHDVVGLSNDGITPSNPYREVIQGIIHGESLFDWCMRQGEYGERILKEWDYELNDKLGIKPQEISRGNKGKAWFTCLDCGNNYYQSILSFTHRGGCRNGCPECANISRAKKRIDRSIQNGNDFYTWCKNNGKIGEKFLSEWDEKENSKLGVTPQKISYCSGYKVCWKCENGHSWKTAISTRTTSITNCPLCSHKVSTAERFMYYCFKQLGLNAELNYHLPSNLGGYGLDVCIAEKRLAIEYNGYRWHRLKRDTSEKEKEKSQICKEYGVRLIHINDGCGTDIPTLENDVISFTQKQNIYRIQLQQIVEILQHEINEVGLIDYDDAYADAICNNKSVEYEDSFEYNYEDLLTDWNYEKNKVLPSQIKKSSGKDVYWKCPNCKEEKLQSPNSMAYSRYKCKRCLRDNIYYGIRIK